MLKIGLLLWLLFFSLNFSYSLNCKDHVNKFKTMSEIQPKILPGEIWSDENIQHSLDILELLCKDRKQSSKKDEIMLRDGHAKSHSCVEGHLTIDNMLLEPPLRVGLFEKNHSYNVFGRFSNASGKIQKDSKPDIKGLALKINQISYRTYLQEKLKEPEPSSQDLLFINSENFFVENSKEYLSFVRAHQKGFAHLMMHGLLHPIQFFLLLKSLFSESRNLLNTEFYSSVPYQLENKVIRTKLAPCLTNVYRNSPSSSISDNLKFQIKNEPYCYNYYIQILDEIELHLVEQPSKKWDQKKSPYIYVGKLELPIQEATDSSKCEKTDFNPWRTHKLNRPMGQINRIRLMVYKAQSLLRNEYNTRPSRSTYLNQNWNSDIRQDFYYKDQGSRIIDLEVFKSLESLGTPVQLFHSKSNLMKYGFLYEEKENQNNSNSLPIGISQKNHQIGITCALCHTRSITYKNKNLIIDGASAEVDLVWFLKDLKSALKNSLNNKAVYERALERYLKNNNNSNSNKFYELLSHSYNFIKTHFAGNPSGLTEGYGRLDAITWIANLLKKSKKETHYLESKSAVSYPYLWNSHQLDWLQWNGAVANSLISPISRNVGQAIASFATIRISETTNHVESSIPLQNISQIQTKLAKLTSPKWPDHIFPPIDKQKAHKGKAIYAKQCLGCHGLQNRNSLNNSITTTFVSSASIGTDRNYTNVALKVKSNKLPGTYSLIKSVFFDYFGKKHEKVGFSYYKDVIRGVLYSQPIASLNEIWLQLKQPIFINFSKKRKAFDKTGDIFKGYRARPLNGIWATAPYLHNGSVPTLYDLLTFDKKRPKKFNILPGTIDTVKVGLNAEVEDTQAFTYNTNIPGNFNTGHNYGTFLKEYEKWQLIEYLKTL